MGIIKHRLIKYPVAFCVTVFLAFCLLLLSAFLPQEQIDSNVKNSARIMAAEGTYPVIGDRTDGAILDNYTDAIMLMQSKSLSQGGLRTILTNPMYSSGTGDPVQDLYDYVHDPDPEFSWHYYRYWMGFRVILRLILCFMDYYQLKRYIAFAFFLLFAILLCDIGKRINQKTAIAFAVSIILVRPYVICNSIQFSTCFFIAFLSMLLVPWIYRNPKYEKLFFMEIGMITMYFDFYTTPILTFGLPMVYLYMLRAANKEHTAFKQILQNGLTWLGAYGLMWIAKLVLTTLLTPFNGFENSISVFLYNLNAQDQAQSNYFVTIIETFGRVLSTVVPHSIDLAVAAIVFTVFAVWFMNTARKGRVSFRTCRNYVSLFGIALFPLAWYIVSARPLVNHYYFQNRSVAVIFWVIGCYLCLICENGSCCEATQARRGLE